MTNLSNRNSENFFVNNVVSNTYYSSKLYVPRYNVKLHQ